MNWRTTAILFLILVLLGGFVFYQSRQEAPVEPTPTVPSIPLPETVDLIADAAVDDVQRLEIRRRDDGQAATFMRDAAGLWSQTVPTATQVVSATMVNYVTSLVNLNSRRSLSPDANPLSAYGLDQPAHEITIAANLEGTTVRYDFAVGNTTPSDDAYYLQRRGDPRVHIVTKSVIDNIIGLLDNPPIPTPTATSFLTTTVPITSTIPISGTGTPEP